MTEFLALDEAVRKYVTPGCSLAAEGFTHLIPHAAGLEIIRQNIRRLTLIRMTPGFPPHEKISLSAQPMPMSWS